MDSIYLAELFSEWGCHLGSEDSLELFEDASPCAIHQEVDAHEST